MKPRQLSCYEIMWHCLHLHVKTLSWFSILEGGALHPAELKPPTHAPTLSACVSHVIYVNSQSSNLPTFPAWQFVTFPWGLPWRRCVCGRGRPVLVLRCCRVTQLRASAGLWNATPLIPGEEAGRWTPPPTDMFVYNPTMPCAGGRVAVGRPVPTGKCLL